MPPRFSKIESPELIFPLKLESWEQIFANWCIRSWNSRNWRKVGLQMQFFFSQNRSEVSGAGKGLEMVGLKSNKKKKRPEKGSWGQHGPVPLSSVSAPLPLTHLISIPLVGDYEVKWQSRLLLVKYSHSMCNRECRDFLLKYPIS